MGAEEKDLALNVAPATGGGVLQSQRALPSEAPVYLAERWALRKLLQALKNPQIQVTLWNGEEIRIAAEPPLAGVVIRDRAALYKLVVNPDLHFGDAYSAGRIEVEGDLVTLLEAVYRASPEPFSLNFMHRAVSEWMQRRPRPNTLRGSRDNIHRHYDIGNDFYRLWLDERMVYTCAYFPEPDATLEDAQVAKMHHVARKLRLQPGETVVEAGCGWGALALHLAKYYGVKVRAFNISQEQIAFARERLAREDLGDRVEFIQDDYRNIVGQYDAFVSVGMLEHVGKQHYREFGDTIHRSLKDDGRGLVHSIGRNRPELMNAWVERRIFPGAYPPTLGEMMEIFESSNFSILDVENLRLHYAKTLEHWLVRYEKSVARVTEAFGPQFVRAWRLYLAGSLAAFSTGSLQLFQVVFARGTSNAVPWTRDHLYRG